MAFFSLSRARKSASFGGLLGGLVHALVGVVGGGDGRLHQRDGVLGAGRGVLDGGVDHGHELLLRVGSGFLGDLAHFGVGGRGDVVQVAAVGSSLFSQRLEQAGLQGHQFLCVFHAQNSAGVGGGFGQSSARSGQVQLHQLFHAFEGLVGQTKQGFNVGFVGGEHLFRGQGHVSSPVDVKARQKRDLKYLRWSFRMVCCSAA